MAGGTESVFDDRPTATVKRALADLIEAADEAHTDFVFVPDLLAAIGWKKGCDYAAAVQALRFSAEHPELKL